MTHVNNVSAPVQGVSLKALRLDMTRAEGGRWVPFIVSPVELLIGSVKSRKFQDGYADLLRDRLRHIVSAEARADIERECRLEAAAKWLLLGWRHLNGDDGKPLPYSWQKALEMLKDPELVELLDFVWAESGETEKYRQAALDDSVKN